MARFNNIQSAPLFFKASIQKFFCFLILISTTNIVFAEDGYDMWLRYVPVSDASLRKNYSQQIKQITVQEDSAIVQSATLELQRGLSGLLNKPFAAASKKITDHSLVLGTPKNSAAIAALKLDSQLAQVGDEGYLIQSTRINNHPVTVIAANTDRGLLYGSFHLLRLIQTQQSLNKLAIVETPKLQHRVVNHWDNLNRLVERGYAGLSLWDWGTLPELKSQRYTDYARINASLGINGTVINNVNADSRILSDQFLQKAAALADAFRPYGIKLFLSINYNSPRNFGDLDTADPLDPRVQEWWKERTKKVYSYIPDFGGYLVKADSEGQPGPQVYGRNHADGANVLAEALKPYGGVVFWRAFVYHPDIGDRFRGAYDEFKPLDGKFADNVILQVKNGPIDFQPREPFSPLFAAMQKTNLMMEVQVSQEYFGFSTHFAYAGELFEEVLNTETFAKGKGSTIKNILQGKVFNTQRTGMAAVINPGTDRNWMGHPFIQSSWYSFGRLAWNPDEKSEPIAEDWLRMTFSNEQKFLFATKKLMMASREAGVNYRSPLGLTHLYSQGDHYGPAPWTSDMARADWNAIYYHRAAKDGIGFDRTSAGSNALAQYPSEISKIYSDPHQVPENLMLWFHHLPWNFKMSSGKTLWDELVHKYYDGATQVTTMKNEWNSVKNYVDEERFERVAALLNIQEREAIRWRDSCVVYFQSFSELPIPDGLQKPEHDLEYYKKLARTLYVPDPWHPAGNNRNLK